METIYVIRSNKNDSIKGDKVYLNKEDAEKQIYYADLYENYYVDSIELPFVGKYVSYVRMYCGFDYGMDSMYDVVYKTDLFPSVEKAKETKLWKDTEKLVVEKPDEFNVYPNKICSRDFGTDDWYYGDVMEGKINTEIKRLKVKKAS